MSDFAQMTEFENEPVAGLPEHLPPGERILWQGAPRWAALALHAFRVRAVALYFGILMAWRFASGVADGESLAAAFGAALWLAPLAAAALGVLGLLAWLSARATIYTITDRRIVLRFGVALPMSVNLPFRLIESASLKRHRDASGDIALTLDRGQRVAYLALWPHVRPWRMSRPQPMLRALAEPAAVADTLAAALAASAGQAPARVAGAPAQPAPAPLAVAAS
jgi:hypothetical protein